MVKRLLSGNEAVAMGAWEAGAPVASGYPGTPSTEILETYARYPGVYAELAPNEKVALDTSIGAAYAGRRAFATMKHVGLNVAVDSLMYAGMTGIEAGLVIVTADDPGMHSSQNEQDNRQFAKFARIPCLSPSDSQEAKDFMVSAFDISEKFDTPVLLRLTTRICHTSCPVELATDTREIPALDKYPRNHAKYVSIPANAIKMHLAIEKRIISLSKFAEEYPNNKIEIRSPSLGIIVDGISYQYAREVFPEASILKLGMVYPLPYQMIMDFAKQVEKLIVIEELDPFIEQQVRLMGVELYEPRSNDKDNPLAYRKSIFPICGELNVEIVRQSAINAGLIKPGEVQNPVRIDADIPARYPVLCPGCPHRSTFYVLNKLGLPVNGDIGCYTLGVLPPLNAIDTCGCMGAGIGVAHGAAVAGDSERHIAVIGDSTFFHSGIPALMNVVYNRSNVITIIMDNRVTGMTGHQDNPGTGMTLQKQTTFQVDIEMLVRSLGLHKVKTIDAYKVKEIEKTLKEWIRADEAAVLITRHECALLPSAKQAWVPLRIDEMICNGCGICFRIGCPAIKKSEKMDSKYDRPLAEIDPLLCTGCEICAQVCPRTAILFRHQLVENNGDIEPAGHGEDVE